MGVLAPISIWLIMVDYGFRHSIMFMLMMLWKVQKQLKTQDEGMLDVPRGAPTIGENFL